MKQTVNLKNCYIPNILTFIPSSKQDLINNVLIFIWENTFDSLAF